MGLSKKNKSQLLFGGVSDQSFGKRYNDDINKPEAFFRWLIATYRKQPNAAKDLSELANIKFNLLWDQYMTSIKSARVSEMFLYWFATVWIHHNDIPKEAHALEDFNYASTWEEYNVYLMAGGKLPKRPLTLEEIYLMDQLCTRTPHTCFINTEQPEQPMGQISQYYKLTPKELWSKLQTWYGNPALDHPWADLPLGICPLSLLVYDGARVAHVITAYAVWKNRLHYTDSWPGRSLLCKENNSADIQARKSNIISPGWSITTEEFQRVVFAFFLYKYPLVVVRQRNEHTK